MGAMVGAAAGDALGAGYEFGPPLPDNRAVEMIGGGSFGWEPGEWTDDTSMAIPILRALAAGHTLEVETTLDGVVAEWVGWSRTAKDVGAQTASVLGELAVPTAKAARAASRGLHERTGRSAGNGSLMRTAPVPLAKLGDGREAELVAVARAVSGLTHFDSDAGDACALWCLAIRHAVRTGDLDLTGQLRWLPQRSRQRWSELIVEAEARQPREFTRNGWVIEALQGAWSAIVHGDGLVDILERAVRGGYDTDTVAAIAGALAGAALGASAVPEQWRATVHGWPGLTADDLAHLSLRAARFA
jgi:ADP-ribosylglycohydrolase